jgi:(E)-4-hydroxy-3-methylbut-2-enyl-diphosphate synthase
MVYLSGMKAHAIDDEAMLDHIVRLVEEKAAAIEAGEATAFDPHTAPAQATVAAE